jgi:hypothetical protein
LNERVWGFLRVKHLLYLFLAVIFLWRGYSACSPAMLSMSAMAGFLALLPALSFEAKLLVLYLHS